MKWNDKALAKLRELWAAGNSASMIAPELSPLLGKPCTRNMVIGMGWRLGLPKRRTRVRRTYDAAGSRASSLWTPERNAALKKLWTENVPWYDILDELGIDVSYSSLAAQAWRLGAGRPVAKRTRKPLTKTLSMMGLDFNAPPAEERKSLLDLDRHDCRYPIGEPEEDGFAFCAMPVAKGESYCPAHYVICHKEIS